MIKTEQAAAKKQLPPAYGRGGPLSAVSPRQEKQKAEGARFRAAPSTCQSPIHSSAINSG